MKAVVGRIAPGLAAAAAVGGAATGVSMMHGGPQMLYALFFGLALHFALGPRLRPGIEFAASGVLRLGVALLGARITAGQIVALGWSTATVVVAAVASTLALALWLGGRLGLGRAPSVQAGGAVAICGASAALAIAAMLPRDKDSERYTLIIVVAVTLMSTLAMVLYPLFVRGFGLPPALGGLFLGGTIHDVAQVVGAGYTINPATGDAATLVKLFRVTLLTVVVAGVSVGFRAQRAAQGREGSRPGSRRLVLLPWFLWVFVALVCLNSTVTVPDAVQDGAGWLSRACLVTAIAALGVKTSFGDLARLGWRPLALIGAETAWLALFVASAVLLLR